MRGRRPNIWSLDRPGDLLALSLGTAVGVGNFLVLPSLVVYQGGLPVLLAHVLSLLLLGAPLVIAEMVWARWLVRPYTQSFRDVGRGMGWIPIVVLAAVICVAPVYFVQLGQTGALLTEVIVRKGYAGATVRSAINASAWRSYSATAAFFFFCAAVTLGSAARVARAMKWLLGFAIPAWAFLSAWTLRRWGMAGLERILYWPSEPIPLEVWVRVGALSLFSLSAGFGILYTYVFYSSQIPRETEEPGGGFWMKSGAIARTVGWVVIGDLFASLASLVIVSPYGLTGVGAQVTRQSSAVLVLDWVPQILTPAPGGPFLVCLHLAALVAAGLASAVSLFDWVVFHLEQEMNWPRARAVFHAWLLGMATTVLVLVPFVREKFDFLGSSILLPLAALLLSFAVGWKMPEKAQRQIFGRGLILDQFFVLWRVSIRYLTPAFLIYILLRR